MDRLTRTTNIVKAYYRYKNTGEAAPFVKDVCNFFDYIKDKPLSESDISFLLFLSNAAGVPHYFDLLHDKYNEQAISDENINLLTLSAYFHDASLIKGDKKLHRYQKYVLERFVPEANNRYVLTAPTSFGKTFIVYEVIRKMSYQNVLLVFPSISLLSENYARLNEDASFEEFCIHSLSEDEYNARNKNIFIFTPERYLSFMDKNLSLKFDFSFVDEVYKIDNSFIIDQETTGENERDTAYRLALEFICQRSEDMLLAGPYMTLPDRTLVGAASFTNFAAENRFDFLDFNDIEIVDKTYQTVKGRKKFDIDDTVIEGASSNYQKISNIIEGISSSTENTIIYCGRKYDTERYAKALLEQQDLISKFEEKCAPNSPQIYKAFLHHLDSTFGSDWVVLNALKARIGVHHSLIPKYIQKEIINLFNQGALICLFSTTTITEGVNTTAKNIIITSNMKGPKPLKQFDAKNIAGRAGRFLQHYVGRVIDLDNGFESIVEGSEENIKHKNYDIDSPKTDVDYQITKDQYLSSKDLEEKQHLEEEVSRLKIPPQIFNSFRIVGPKDKLLLYNQISKTTPLQARHINSIAIDLARSNAKQLNWDGFQLVMEKILPVVKEEKLKNLIEKKTGEKQIYSLITVLLSKYLNNGFMGMVDYYTNRGDSKDKAMRNVADYVYNVFKYHLVKYLGVFDIFYRYYISQKTGKTLEDIPGMGMLLQKLEYNALNSTARRLSDFGVPFKLVSHYDTDNPAQHKNFDEYELYIDATIQRLLN